MEPSIELLRNAPLMHEPTAAPETLERLADMLWEAQRTGDACTAPTSEVSTLTPADGYAIQDIIAGRRQRRSLLSGTPARRVGYKVGITSEAVQAWIGVAEPDFGILFDDMLIPDTGIARTDKLLQGRAEGEIAFVMKHDLAGPGVTAAHVIRATDFVLPAIEIVDSRVANWEVKYPDTIADNASSGQLVLGTTPTRLTDVDLVLAGVAMAKNGRIVSTGVGGSCLGNPVNAIVWLANRLGESGGGLREGDVIISGALCPVTPCHPGDHVEVRIAHLGNVSVRF